MKNTPKSCFWRTFAAEKRRIMEEIELEVSILDYPSKQGETFNLVLREKGGNRFVPVLIGLSEAKHIIMEVNHIKIKRPFAHDVLLQLAARMNCKVEKVLIDDYHEGIFYVHIYMIGDGGSFTLDARVSDAVVIALKSGAPIMMTLSVFNKASYDISQLADGSFAEKKNESQNIIVINEDDYHEDEDDDDDEYEDDEDDEDDGIDIRGMFIKKSSSEKNEMQRDIRYWTMEDLQQSLEDAIADEDYERAAEIDEEIKRRNQYGRE